MLRVLGNVDLPARETHIVADAARSASLLRPPGAPGSGALSLPALFQFLLMFNP